MRALLFPLSRADPDPWQVCTRLPHGLGLLRARNWNSAMEGPLRLDDHVCWLSCNETPFNFLVVDFCPPIAPCRFPFQVLERLQRRTVFSVLFEMWRSYRARHPYPCLLKSISLLLIIMLGVTIASTFHMFPSRLILVIFLAFLS